MEVEDQVSGAAFRGRRPTVAVVVLAAAVLVLTGVLVAAALNHSLSYYRTPTQLVTSPQGDRSVRVGGLVVAGSVHHTGARVRFVLTDGAHDLHVVTTDAPPATFRAGQGAVVEGHLLPDGVFSADQVMVRHSNEYQPPGSRAAPTVSLR
jgi:cytochrome c-type biogenesis protein CcmE